MEKIIGEYRFTIGQKGFVSMYDTISGEMVFREKIDNFDRTAVAVGVKGFRMLEGHELEEFFSFLDEWKKLQ